MPRPFVIPLLAAIVLAVVACAGQPPAQPTAMASAAQPTAAPTATVGAATPTAAPTATTAMATAATTPAATTTPAAATTPTAEPAVAAEIRLVPAPEGNEARYRVREQFANQNLPSDAIGKTSAITGTIVLRPDGTIVGDQSKFTVDLRELRSDSDRRDNFIRQNTLQTNSFPSAQFVPTEIQGLPSPLPTSGEVKFKLIGDLTVRDVTRPATWEVVAQILDQSLKGTATTDFTFTDFGLTKPRVAMILSVDDSIRLELDFHLVRAPERSAQAAR